MPGRPDTSRWVCPTGSVGSYCQTGAPCFTTLRTNGPSYETLRPSGVPHSSNVTRPAPPPTSATTVTGAALSLRQRKSSPG